MQVLAALKANAESAFDVDVPRALVPPAEIPRAPRLGTLAGPGGYVQAPTEVLAGVPESRSAIEAL